MDWEFGVNRCKLLLWKWISNVVPLYSPENYIQSLVIEYDGEKEYKHIYVKYEE